MTVGSAQTRLIVLRGNSGSGKSSVAMVLREAYGRGLAWVSQDLIRRIILRERDRPGRSVPCQVGVSRSFDLATPVTPGAPREYAIQGRMRAGLRGDERLAVEQGEGFGKVRVVSGGQVVCGEWDVVVGCDADPVDEFVVGADFVLRGQRQYAAVVKCP